MKKIDWPCVGGYECWNKYFKYDQNTGVLINKISRSSKALAGAPCGCVNSSGYLQAMILGKNRMIHRIIWEMNNGPIPEGIQVDHIDHNRTNNRIENMRIVTHQQNNQNRTIPKNNTSGACGVGWRQSEKKWYAKITVNGKPKHLGRFKDVNDAISARKAAEAKYGFHPNHGDMHICTSVEDN
ncbi:HNH endonuclease signature motif containing protein [Yersinia alsatica]|uniref:HNH endonuclease signature motif containing protein n=1 Tax=Yersinia alsatica TaxID=2890317 RepID=UPI0011A63BE0|nr:HNH endonuclease signature motif containing protein [Yersinia alsatica]